MRYLFRFPVAIALLLSLVIGSLSAKPAAVPIDQLTPDRQHRQTALVVTKLIDKFHYRKLPLDDALSESIFERYMESLDVNKTFLTQEDITRFDIYRLRLDDALKQANVDGAFTMFVRFRERVEERVELALAMLEAYDFDFRRDESYRFDREDAAWAADDAALDDLWRRRIKNDILALRMTGKTDKEIRKTLSERYQAIARRVQQFTADDVFQSFVSAYSLSIEPHTSYMSPRVSENFDISMRLSLQGIGAVLRSENEYTLVQSTVTGGPAARSGVIAAGDRIVGVGQGQQGKIEDVVGWRLQDVVDLIRGPKGSVVRLNILPKRMGADGPTNTVQLVRDEIRLEDQAAQSRVLEGLDGTRGLKLGVIEIPAFYRDFRAQSAGEREFRSTTRDVRALLAELEGEGVDGIVIDLRDNGGGSLTEATELTGLFIREGPVVQVKDAAGRIDVERDPDPEQVYQGPLAVLVDRDSASASEIFAGAIQDYRRGVIVGEPTFGKGTVQTLVDVGRFVHGDADLGRLRLTMAQFFRVNGSSTQHRGVVPDIVFPTAKGAVDHGERGLENALPWASIEPADYQADNSVSYQELLDLHLTRVAASPGFDFLVAQENELAKIEARHTISLQESVRRAEWEAREQRRLERLNRLRAARGLPALTSLDDDEEALGDEDDDPERINDIMVEEAARILADVIHNSTPLTAQLAD